MQQDIWVILVDGNISRDGYFIDTELDIARERMRSYEPNYKTQLKRIKRYGIIQDNCCQQNNPCGC